MLCCAELLLRLVSRPRSLLVSALLSVAACPAMEVPPQRGGPAAGRTDAVAPSSQPQQQEVIAVLRDPSGAAVAGAQGWLHTEPAWRLAALPSANLSRFTTAAPRAQDLLATSSARGVLKFALPSDGSAFAGSGMVTTEAGLGALIPRSHAKRATLITLQPMALVTTATGSESFEMLARADLPDGAKLVLPRRSGTAIRLPAGDYEIWASGRDGLIWQRLHLEPGLRNELQFDGAAQRLQLDGHTHVHPAGLPDLSLLSFAGEAFGNEPNQVTLRGAALAAPWVSWSNGIVTPERVVPGPPQPAARAWPPPSDRIDRPAVYQLAADAPRDSTLLGLVRNDDRTFRAVAFASSVDGKLQMPICPNGDSWLLLLAPGCAAQAQPWSTTASGHTFAPQAGQPLRVEARDQGTLPIADLAVSYTPEGQDAATVLAYTDATGHACFGPVHGPGTLHLNDPRYANQEVELQLLPTEPLPLRVAAGETLTATVKFADDAAGDGIVVTLRDPRGLLRPRERSLVTTVATPFQFAGLPSEHDMLLIATATRDGKTWSARRIVNAMDEGVELVLINEDPVLHR